MSAAFQVEGLEKRFGANAALREVSLTINAGERVALIGPSGSGKTTLLRLLGTQMAPSAGSLEVFDFAPANLSEAALRRLRTRIAFLPQDLGLVSKLRVIQNVIAARSGRRHLWQSLRDLLFPSKEEREAIHGLLQRVGIPEKLYDRLDSLSGGQQQRVALARALYQEPEALLADEPISSVDPARARSLLGLLTQISEEEDLTLVASIHQIDLAKAYFPRLIGLKDGRVLFDAPPEAISPEAFGALYQLEDASDD